MSKPQRVAIYVRVSTDAQNTDAQRQELEAWADRAGHPVVKVYEDQGAAPRDVTSGQRSTPGCRAPRDQHDRRLVVGSPGALA